jgi:hypothetical protein
MVAARLHLIGVAGAVAKPSVGGACGVPPFCAIAYRSTESTRMPASTALADYWSLETHQ